MNKTWIATTGACSVLSVLAAASTASAGIASWSGQLQLVGGPESGSNPVSFEYGQLASNDHMALFVETLSHTLEADLMADIPGQAGTWHRFNRPAQPFAIPAGSSIDSYFIHQDLVGNNPNFGVLMSFSITFEQPILGLIVGGDWADGSLFRTTLDDSDFLGGVEYTTNADLRRRGALEGTTAEHVTISDDGYTLSGSLHSTGVHVDNLRVITMGSVIPAPGSVFVVGLAALAVSRRRRRD
ncbi:MAG: hypothetical protein ACIAQF_04210 [Phycisphaerales bacterium JB065]